MQSIKKRKDILIESFIFTVSGFSSAYLAGIFSTGLGTGPFSLPALLLFAFSGISTFAVMLFVIGAIFNRHRRIKVILSDFYRRVIKIKELKGVKRLNRLEKRKAA